MAIKREILECIALVARSKADAEGWCVFTPRVIDAITSKYVSDFIEFERDKLRVRLTNDGKVIAKYCL